MRIAICEDNLQHADILETMVKRWAKEQNIHVDIGRYTSAEQFLFFWKEDAHYDLAFLDIQMEKMNGMQLARYIRDQDPTMILVFTTGIKDYVFRAFEVTAFRYLIKPLKERDVSLTLSKANKEIECKKDEALVVNVADDYVRIYKNDIYYVESDDHEVIIHTTSGNYRIREKLKNIEEQLPAPQFCKTHRSYIVNLRYVDKITKAEIYLEKGVVLPISKARWSELNQCYIRYFTRR